MVMVIMKDILFFLLVLLCVLTGFAQGFWLLRDEFVSDTTQFAAAQDSYFATFMYMFGEIKLEVDNNVEDFAKVFQVAFMITMLILLLNLLIALMNDSFNKVKEEIRSYYWKDVATFMTDQALMTPIYGTLHLLHRLPCFTCKTQEGVDEAGEELKCDEWVYVLKYASDYVNDQKTISQENIKSKDNAKVLLACKNDRKGKTVVFEKSIIDRTVKLKPVKVVVDRFAYIREIWDMFRASRGSKPPPYQLHSAL